MAFEIKECYVERPEPAYFLDDPKNGITYQPDVYWVAFGLAVELGARRIVDIGCGYAPKLAQLQAHRPDWDFVGIDHGRNIDWCRVNYAAEWGEWLAIDLEHPHDYDAEGAVIVCADVIEHLKDPLPLLAGIESSGCAASVISTPERDLTWGTDHMGPPPNPCHVREWNAPEFDAFLSADGLAPDSIGVTRSDDAGTGEKTILAVKR